MSWSDAFFTAGVWFVLVFAVVQVFKPRREK